MKWQLVACSLTGLFFWLSICYTMRYTLKLLLMYKGWMYESRGSGSSVSLQTKVWAGATKVLSSWNQPGLYSFQGSLPRLPLPSVHDTLDRVCDSCRSHQWHLIITLCLFFYDCSTVPSLRATTAERRGIRQNGETGQRL